MPDTFAKLTWDDSGTRFYHTGVDHGVLYVQDDNGTYPKGVAWNGLTSVSSTPEGAEATDLWADNMKYASFRSAETFGGSIGAYTFPPEFYPCDGYASPTGLEGMYLGQQARKKFGFCYRTKVGNDITGDASEDYVLHLVYGASVSPSEQTHETINDSPDAMEFSWDFDTTPVAVNSAIASAKPTAYIELDSRKLGSAKMTAIENVLYGSSTANARLPLPDEVATILSAVTGG